MRQVVPSAVRSRGLLLAGVAGVAALLAGCSAGQNAQTAATEPSVPGVHADAGGVALRNVQIAYPDREHRSYPRGGNAPLKVRIFNPSDAPDALVDVTSEAARGVVLVGTDPGDAAQPCPAAAVQAASGAAAPGTPAPGAPGGGTPAGSTEFTIDLAPGSCALLDTGEPYHLELVGLRQAVAPGETVAVTFTFRNAGEVTLQVPFGMPTAGAEHTPVDIHPVEPSAVLGDHDTGEGSGH